jgi:hypothetical protein
VAVQALENVNPQVRPQRGEPPGQLHSSNLEKTGGGCQRQISMIERIEKSWGSRSCRRSRRR